MATTIGAKNGILRPDRLEEQLHIDKHVIEPSKVVVETGQHAMKVLLLEGKVVVKYTTLGRFINDYFGPLTREGEGGKHSATGRGGHSGPPVHAPT